MTDKPRIIVRADQQIMLDPEYRKRGCIVKTRYETRIYYPVDRRTNTQKTKVITLKKPRKDMLTETWIEPYYGGDTLAYTIVDKKPWWVRLIEKVMGQ